MILLNTTFCVDEGVREEFIGFLKETYIPVAQAAGLTAPLLTGVRGQAEPNIVTGQKCRSVALQMRAPSEEVLDAFCSDILLQLYNHIGRTWQASVGMFETRLDVIYNPANE